MSKIESIPAIVVANYFIESGNGEYSPLKIQKLIYIANLLHIRRFNISLVKESFHAWEYGPVIPGLYHELKQYGRLHVRNPIKTKFCVTLDSDQLFLLDMVDKTFGCMAPSRLVRLTHLEGGAWDKNYIPGARVKIPEDNIVEEAMGIR